MKQIAISMKHISKKYHKEVLKDVSLEIDNRSFVAICGESGAGKSTFMNILGLVEDYDAGEYIFNGTKIKHNTDYANLRLDNIGFIFQAYNLIPNMSCLQNILLPLQYGKRDKDIKERFEQLVNLLRIESLLEQNINVLSGGEKQRVAIARALLRNPGLIIADEPTGNLDQANKEIILELLAEEHKKGRGIVVITHDAEVADVAKTKLELKGGCLYEGK